MLTEQSQRDVDQEVGTATTLEEDTQRRDEEGDNDLADIAVIKAVSISCSSKSTNVASATPVASSSRWARPSLKLESLATSSTFTMKK